MADDSQVHSSAHSPTATRDQGFGQVQVSASHQKSSSPDSTNHRIAIVGMACRFPGAPDLATFWEKLVSGTNCVFECPPGAREGRVGELYEDTSIVPSACRFGAFLTDIDQFDAEFFRISPSEAEFLDPQQRMMLETSWRALENANIDPEQLRGSSASVFAGMSNNDYRYLILGGADTSQPASSLYTITGTSLNTAIGRVSFALGFEGPAMTVDTACSSSLVAMHQAATTLQLEETDVALAGGVQLILSGKLTELRANAGMLSPDGTCKTFDEAANGYVRGEGCGIVVLKRLEDAQRDGDHIWAEVAATAINQDGTSEGLTVPRGSAQRAVIVAALDQANVQPVEVDYLEAHGTGTPVGDPVEINAAAEVYGAGRNPNQPLLIGSVKTNIGHLEPAAGVAGVIKAAMAIRFGHIPKHLNFENPSPEIAWDRLPVKVVQESMSWPQKDIAERLAGINSFGFSGTNAHVLLRGVGEFLSSQEATAGLNAIQGPPLQVESSISDELKADLSDVPLRQTRLLPLSAKSPDALIAVCDEYQDWLNEQHSGETGIEPTSSSSLLSDFCWTASIGRSHFNYRRALLIDSTNISTEELRRSISEQPIEPSKARSKIAFAYTGQGSQWAGMGKALYESEPVFKHIIDQCDEVIRRERDSSLTDRLFGAPGTEEDLEDPKWVQPCIYAIECALTDLWASLGVKPDVVLGHSLGEIAAARTAGVFSLEDGCRFASARGRLMSKLPGPGAMAAVFLSEEEANEAVEAYNEEVNGVGVSIAALNGAHQALSGYAHELEPLLEQLEKQEVRVRRLKRSPAYHSALVEPILDELADVIDQLHVAGHTLPLVSNLTGNLVGDDVRLDSSYWRGHARQGVAYRKGVDTLASLDVDAVLEIGPNAVLGPMTQLSWPEEKEPPAILASLRMPRDDRPEIPSDGGFLNCVAEAYENGVDIDFRGLYAGEERRKLNIPGYVFQHRRHWVQTSRRRTASSDHPLLGSRHESPRGEIYYETELSPEDPNWLKDHRVFGQILIPGAFYGSMGVSCADTIKGALLDELQLHSPMVFKDSSAEEEENSRRLQLVLQSPNKDSSREFEVFSKDPSDDDWTLHATGRISRDTETVESTQSKDLGELTSKLDKQDLGEYYKQKSATNIQLGTPFRNLKNLWTGSGEAVAEISIREEHSLKGIELQPLVLDACFQVLSAARQSTNIGEGATYIPFGWERLSIAAPLDSNLVCHARMNEIFEGEATAEASVPEALTGDLWIYDRSGRQLASLSGFTVKRATRSSFLSAVEDPTDLIYEVVWRNIDHPATARREHPLAEVSELQSNVEPFFSYLRAQGVTPEERYSLLLDLEKLAHSWVITSLDDHGLERTKGISLQADELMVQMGILPIHKNLVDRILRMMVEASVLSRSSDGDFEVMLGVDDSLPKGLSSPNELFNELREKHPYGQYELTLLNRFGSNFIELLTGEADPLALLFEEDSSGAADFYKTAPVSIAGNRLLGDVIARLVNDLPEDRLLRVLEVGAGTGATTEIVFSELETKRLEYTYTDISPGFFSEAERNFEGNGIDIEYRPLDIENDPSAQGFEESYYDIVIAANVLHATRNLYETLSNCRQLLVPGGMLIALESLRGRAWQDLTFGFLDGWWRFNDPYRKNHALASPDIWRSALADSGYIDAVVFGDETITDTSGPLGSGTIVAQAPVKSTLKPGTWIIETDSGGLADRLAKKLQSIDQSVILTRCENSNSANAARQDAEVGHNELPAVLAQITEEQPLRGVVHLAALDGRGVEATTHQLAQDIKNSAASALSLTQELMGAGVRPTNGTWFVTRGAQVLECEQTGMISGSALWGFGKVAGLESSFLGARMVDLDPDSDSFENLVDELLTPSEEDHLAFRRNTRYVARLVKATDNATRIQIPEDPAWILSSGDDGSLANVQTARFEQQPLQSREVRVQVETTGLNFSDVLVALGAQAPNASLGLEFAGYVTELASDVDEFVVGQRVVGMGFGTFGPEVTTHADLVAEAPPDLRLDQLATLPIVFATAGIAFDLAGLKAGDRVLVHAASGGVGLAAIQLVQAAGAEVFATASKPKQQFLRAMGIEYVFDSRQLDFGNEILKATSNEGVDIVLNSLTSEGFIDTSLACLKENGRFVEIGRLNILTPEQMAQTRPDVDYHILSLDELKRNEPQLVGRAFRKLVARFESGELNPLRHSKWPMAEIGDALQYMGSARHVGKLVLGMPALAHGNLKSDRSYLVTGGFGGIGCAVAVWLAENGAKNIVLNGRRNPEPEAMETIEQLRAHGIRIETQIADMTDTSSIDSMLDYIDREMPLLGGIVHSVGVLSDGSITNQTWERFEEVLWPKILGAWHLHQATRRLDLDLFVLFSSATGVLGNAGQANHAAANAFLDQLAAHRRSLGLCGQAIAWGAWSDIGEAAEQRERIATQLETTGTEWISPELGIRTLDYLVSHDLKNPAAMSVDWAVLEQHLDTRPALLKELLATDEDTSDSQSDAAGLDIDELRTVQPSDRVDALMSFIQAQLQSILRLASPPSTTVGFFDLGMDSLMAVELRNRLLRVLEGEITVSRTAVFDYPNVEALAEHLANELDQSSTPEELAGSMTTDSSSTSARKISVVGLACRLPGASDYIDFWKNLENGVANIGPSRGDDDRWTGVVGDKEAKEPYLRYGGFIDGLDRFDAAFFGIRPIEARLMDPRQRILLETCWEAIENAGIDPASLRGERVGIYFGLGASEYRDLVNANGYEDNYIGTSSGMTTGRISYIFGFTGPAMSFDLACASSLVAIHEGVKALQTDEIDLALVGGANALLSQSIMRFHRELGLLSADGKCLPFDEDAQGYVRGEGCGVLVLKRNDEAVRDGDPIWSTILGSAVNQNGASAGLTVPNGPAQEQLIRDAVARSGIDPSQLDYLEAHATGLSLSDPIEISAACSVYTASNDRNRPLILGSLKSNFGHLEWASGVAGTIKLILSMAQRKIPAQLHLERPSAQIEWRDLGVEVNRLPVDWPENDRHEVSAVSAFGMSGTNAHVIVEGNGFARSGASQIASIPIAKGQPKLVEIDSLSIKSELDLRELRVETPSRRERLLPLSAMSPESVVRMARKLASWLDEQVDQEQSTQGIDELIADVSWTACVGRGHFDYRHVVTFSDYDELAQSLRSVSVKSVAPAVSNSSSNPNIAFALVGLPREWMTIGTALCKSEPAVNAIVNYCNELTLEREGIDIVAAMADFAEHKSEENLDDWGYPATYALQVALALYWQALGLSPKIIVGSDVGKVAAACIAQSVSLEQGLESAWSVGRNRESGADSSDDTNLDGSQIESPQAKIVDASTFLIAETSQELGNLLNGVTTSAEIEAERQSAECFKELGIDCLVEIGPDLYFNSTRLGSGQAVEENLIVVRAVSKEPNDSDTRPFSTSLLEGVKDAYEAHLSLNLRALFSGESRSRLTLPTYRFDRESYWFND